VLVCSITVVLGKGCFLCVDFAGSVTVVQRAFFGADKGHNAPEAE